MSSTQQGVESASNDLGRGKSTRRTWSPKEEAILLASLKELVAQGWKSDNGFKAAYLNKLEDVMRNEFPRTDLKGIPISTRSLVLGKRIIIRLLQCCLEVALASMSMGRT